MLEDQLAEHYAHVPNDADAVRRIQHHVLVADPPRRHILVAAAGLLLVAALVITVQALWPSTDRTTGAGPVLSTTSSSTAPTSAFTDRTSSSPHSSARAGTAPATAARLPPVIDGVPVQRLGRQALATAKGWADPSPTDVRVVLTTWGQYTRWAEDTSQRVPTRGAADPVYVVALTGHFACRPPACSVAIPAPGTATPAPGPDTLSYMSFTVAVPGSPSAGSDLLVTHRKHDLTKLGHVINLQPYIDAIK